MLPSRTNTKIRVTALVAAVLFCWNKSAQAQVGLTSGVAQVSLMAHAPELGSLPMVGPAREIARAGSIRELAAIVRLTANGPYKLVIRRAPGANTRVWVKSEAGPFQELTSQSAVTVDRANGAGGRRERAVYFRLEPAFAEKSSSSLPVLYELMLSPTL